MQPCKLQFSNQSGVGWKWLNNGYYYVWRWRQQQCFGLVNQSPVCCFVMMSQLTNQHMVFLVKCHLRQKPTTFHR